MLFKLDFVTAHDVPMRLVFLPDGISEARPASNKYNRSNEAKVEFFDRRYDFTPDGQFIAEYYAASLLDGDAGLRLYGDSDDWTVDASTMQAVRAWIADRCSDHDDTREGLS